jgi:hypothetical protein
MDTVHMKYPVSCWITDFILGLAEIPADEVTLIPALIK